MNCEDFFSSIIFSDESISKEEQTSYEFFLDGSVVDWDEVYENFYTLQRCGIKSDEMLTLFCVNPNIFFLDRWVLDDKIIELTNYDYDLEAMLKANPTII